MPLTLTIGYRYQVIPLLQPPFLEIDGLSASFAPWPRANISSTP